MNVDEESGCKTITSDTKYTNVIYGHFPSLLGLTTIQKCSEITSSGKGNAIANKERISQQTAETNVKCSKTNKCKNYIIYRKKANERNWKYRARMSEEKRKEKQAKDRELYRKKKEMGLIRGITEKTEKEKQKQRQQWRKASKLYRSRKFQHGIATTLINSETNYLKQQSTTPMSSGSSCKTGQEEIAKNTSKIYRDLKEKEKELLQVKRKLEKYRKIIELQNKIKTKHMLSPSKRVKEFKEKIVSEESKKMLCCGETILTQLKEKYMRNRTKPLHRTLSNKILKKYYLLGKPKNISFKQNKRFLLSSTFQYKMKKEKNEITDIIKELKEFLEDDTNSRIYTTTAKQRINKIHKRILLKSLQECHKTFIEKKEISITYKMFCHMKPFWIIPPKSKHRHTRICTIHSNMHFIVGKLNNMKVIEEKSADDLIGKDLQNIGSSCNLKQTVMYEQWQSTREERETKGETEKVQLIVKNYVSCLLSDLIDELKKQLPIYEKHVFNVCHQAEQLKKKKYRLQNNEVICQICYSKNCITKLPKLKSKQFGTAKKQVSLYTGIIYFFKNGKLQNHSFCTISDCLDNQAYTIWAHLLPVLKKLCKMNNFDTFHFFSDNSILQYRNKENIKHLMQILPTLSPCAKASWNYSESGHDENLMDSIEGPLKKMKDHLVKENSDVTSMTFVKKLRDNKIDVMLINDELLDEMRRIETTNIPSIPGINSLHQITFDSATENMLYTRSLSCFICPFNIVCQHFMHMKGFVEMAPKPIIYNVNDGPTCSSQNHALKQNDWVAVAYNDG